MFFYNVKKYVFSFLTKIFTLLCSNFKNCKSILYLFFKLAQLDKKKAKFLECRYQGGEVLGAAKITLFVQV